MSVEKNKLKKLGKSTKEIVHYFVKLSSVIDFNNFIILLNHRIYTKARNTYKGIIVLSWYLRHLNLLKKVPLLVVLPVTAGTCSEFEFNFLQLKIA